MIFDWFKRPDYTNIVKFPKPVKTPAPYIEPQEYYSIGITNDNQIRFKIGYSTLTMNQKGCENLIEQLELFKNQLRDNDNE
jgi:hypothetical protein